MNRYGHDGSLIHHDEVMKTFYPPREDRRPLRALRFPGAPKNLGKARHMHRWRECLGEDIRELIRCVHLDKLEVSQLNSFMREMLPDVDVLSPLTASDDIVTPLDAGRVVLVHWSP